MKNISDLKITKKLYALHLNKLEHEQLDNEISSLNESSSLLKEQIFKLDKEIEQLKNELSISNNSYNVICGDYNINKSESDQLSNKISITTNK